MEEEGAMEELVRRIEDLRKKPSITRKDMFVDIREHFRDDDECETFITTAITRILAEEQIREYQEFKKDGIKLDLFWNSSMDSLGCDDCRSRHEKSGPWDDSPPPLHSGCRCRLTMRIRK